MSGNTRVRAVANVLGRGRRGDRQGEGGNEDGYSDNANDGNEVEDSGVTEPIEHDLIDDDESTGILDTYPKDTPIL